MGPTACRGEPNRANQTTVKLSCQPCALRETGGGRPPRDHQLLGGYPYGWCLDHGAGPCAQFFGGQTSASPYALAWQWSGGGGVTNGIGGFNGDLDTIDSTRLP